MTLTYGYTNHKPALPESVESLRQRIPGWGADLDPADRPNVPRETADARPEGATWDLPEQQPVRGYRERSIEHADITPVFGTAQPLRGISGLMRRLAYEKYSEARAAHWLLLMAGDRADVLTNTLRSFATSRPDNPLAESGVKTELTHNGLASRLGRGRTDVVHHPLDPVIFFGPWILGAELTRRLIRRARRA